MYRPTINVHVGHVKVGLYSDADVLPRSPCSLNLPDLCDNFVKKLVSEIKKCRQRQLPLDPSGGSTPHLRYTFPLAEGLETLVNP